MPILTDLMLIVENDAASLALMRSVAARMGCDHIEPNGVDELVSMLAMRHPTIAVLAVDRLQNDGYGILEALAQHSVKPATLLVGDVNPRVLAGLGRAAESYGLFLIGTRSRPLDEVDLEQVLMAHVSAPPSIPREELVRALAEHEFSVRYQPKVGLVSDSLEILGVEALIRWEHPRRGQLPPRHFLSCVESHGLIGDLTDFVITESVRQVGVWQGQGMPLALAINLSPRLVKDREFPDRLASLLQEYDLAPQRISLDITETAVNSDRNLILEVFTRLRILGVGLSLDNFGTGLSSLTELYKMPFSEIKVDRALLTDVPRERDAEVVVRAIADLAHDLDMTVCAEGVETREMLDFARSAHFDSAQGNLFCGPVLANDIEKLVRSRSASASQASGVWRNLDRSGLNDTVVTRRLKRMKLASPAEK